MKKNVAYLRVSTEAQTEKYGLDVQREKIEEYCAKKGVAIDKWYIDGGYSGAKLERPAINELLKDAEVGKINTVYVYKLDRMSRDVIDTLNLMYKVLPAYGVKVISMTEEIRTENPMDKVMLTMNAAMNQYEREVIRMRMSAGMVERVKKGLWMGGGRVPFGYYYDRNDGILHPKEDEARIVRKAYELYLEGYSCDRISRLLGFKCERHVAQILKRKSNIGIIRYKGNEYKGKHEPIVDERVYYETQKCMDKRKTNSYISNDHMLTGLCYCGVCGARMRYHKWDGNHRLVCYSQVSGKEYMIRDRNCNNRKRFAKDIEREVENAFKEFAINIGDVSEPESNAALIDGMIKKSNAKIKKFYALYVENENDTLLELIHEEEDRIRQLKSQLDEEQKKKCCLTKDEVGRIRRISDAWDDLSNKDKNSVLKECIERITITNDDIEIRFVI